nr:ribonuclease H-like domain-containing protein [Tanacetum cinerariifolium]
MDHEQPPTAQNEIPPLITPNPPENPNPDSVRPMVTHGTLSCYKARLVANGSTQLKGVDVDETFNLDSSGMFLSQKKYVVEIRERAYIVNCNPSRTPVDTESKQGIQQICLYMHDPREPHLSAPKRILRYVRDADWAGCPTTRRSTSGYCVFLGNNLFSWSSMRQPMLSRSSAEAEYRGVANDVDDTCWLRNLLRELHTSLSSAMLVYYDNVSAVYLSCNPVQHQRTKHIEIDIHFVRDLVSAGQVCVLHVPSRYQFADIFTKGLPSALFEEFRSSLSVRCPPAPTAREC